jgi:hypothetical protein
VGNYVFEDTRVLDDSEVDMLRQETCRALVMSQVMKVHQSGTEVVKGDAIEALISQGVVRTDREAKKISLHELIRRMKHIKVSATFHCGESCLRLQCKPHIRLTGASIVVNANIYGQANKENEYFCE